MAVNYFHWSGRWSGIGLALVILPRVDMMKWYPILLEAIVFVQALGLWAYWRMLLGEKVSRRHLLALVSVSLAVFWASLPVPGQTHYWVTGGIENQLNIWLSLLLMGGLVRARWDQMSLVRSHSLTGLLCVLAIFVTGMHELIGLMLCIVLATGTYIALKTGRSGRGSLAWGLVSLGAVIGLAVVMAAPGNRVRSLAVAAIVPQEDQNLLHALKLAGVQAKRLLPTWAFDVRLLAAAVVLVLSPSLVGARAGRIRWGGVSPKLVITSLWLLIVAGMFVGPSMVLHLRMAGRTLNAGYALFVLGLFATVVVWARSRAESESATATLQESRGVRFARSGALAIPGLSLVLSGNTRDGIRGLAKGIPQNWHRMIEWRDELIRREKQNGAAELDLPTRNLAAANRAKWPKLYFFEDITEDPTFYVNQCVARYYGLKTIRRVPPAARPRIPLGARQKRSSSNQVVHPRAGGRTRHERRPARARPVPCNDATGRVLPITPEEQARNAKAIADLVERMLAMPDEHPPGAWEEAMRDLDAQRPHRKLFEGLY